MKKNVFIILMTLSALALISLVLGFWLGFLNSFRIVFGIIYVLFLPGFVWSYVFFKTQKNAEANAENAELTDKEKGIDWIERITLSIALSLALVPLVIFFLNKIGVKINLVSVVLEIAGIIIVGLVLIVLRKKVWGRK